MKKYLILLLIIVFSASMVVTAFGCQTATTEVDTTTANAEVTETETEASVNETETEVVAGEENPFEDIKLVYFSGGQAGETFSEYLHKGAMDAAAQLGVKVDFIFSNWTPDTFIQQLREAIAAKPDGIAMMGHAGDDAILPLAEQAYNDGIAMSYHNVDVPIVREQFGGGYVGANLKTWGENTGKKAVQMFDIGPGDSVAVYGVFDQIGRRDLEEASALVFEEAGAKVRRITVTSEQMTSSELLMPQFIADLEANPDTKAVMVGVMTHTENMPMYLEAAGKKPGEIKAIGFNNSPKVMEGFASGYIQLSGEQQPYLQGYIPILSLAYHCIYGFDYFSVDTGGGFITEDNYEEVAQYVQEGIR